MAIVNSNNNGNTNRIILNEEIQQQGNRNREEQIFKILFVGEPAVGKTSLLNRFIYSLFFENYTPNQKILFFLKTINYSGRVYYLQFWDIFGTARTGVMTRVFYSDSVGAFVVCDVTRPETIEAAIAWRTDLINKNVLSSDLPIILLANKWDKLKGGAANAMINKMNLMLQKGFTKWFPTSACDLKTNKLSEALNELFKQIINIRQYNL
eukprot:TRINITY_DN2011_c1_g1_i1.p1 TRINITY_DN2011_c1_g1~~TRINITY_DN2011_c1_g1_i1.p1  ORF type:complete len:209 (-),score=52.66 TRINITY_DN2011_c1_g1_i1:107-733(-)